MTLSHRHRQILELLLSRNVDVTAGEIAAEINVSTRTVHRELTELEAIISSSGLSLQKKSGKGIQLQGDLQDIEAFKRKLHDAAAIEHSSQDRKLFILCTLLDEDEPVKLFALAHSLRVTIPTITNDLDELESWIQKSNLTLIRRRGYGVGLNGTEMNKRKLIARLARNYLDESDLYGKSARSPSPLVMKLLQLIGKSYFADVEAALWDAEDEGLNKLSESEYTRLLIDISILIARMKQGKVIEANVETETIRRSDLLTHTIEQLSKIVPMEWPEAEIRYLAELLQPEEPHPNQLLPFDELSYMEIVWKLIRRMEERSGVSYSEDRSLRDGLLSHLESALKRLQAGATIRNPLLTQIKRDYEELFEAIRLSVNETIIEPAVPDEEIGFLVMHFGASLERQKQLRRNVRAIIVCTSGIGTSKMLAVRLTKELPQIEILGHVSWFEAVHIPEAEYDLIISTVDLPLDDDQYIKLSPLLTKDEAERLRLFIQNVTLQKDNGRDQGVVVRNLKHSTESLHRIRMYVNEIVRIVDGFTVYPLDQSFHSLRETLQVMCEYARQSGYIEDVESIVELLLERERLSSQVIPDTELALFHIRSGRVLEPTLTLFQLKEDLLLDQPVSPGVRHVLLMLGPQELPKESLEVLSEISSYLLLPEMIELLRTGEQSEIKQFLSRELTAFLENKK
ncbi:PRD domain-containing protein [Paenibacillus sp. H1-7]|uniref:BglG family transcription antiterminator n=1 Tax=Paenibacillus sp. H1-7 TaxID=2282849 RepID=UPI001EF7E182|nr:BglG family transcription antiterminator [Paenibacillus sp. H1-7]ULL18394.1 PRD domain-containing protein [Paenibacillus sp. H1-7]